MCHVPWRKSSLRLFRVLARLPPKRPLSYKDRESLGKPAPAQNSLRIYTRFPFPVCSSEFLAAIARDRRPNCEPGRLEEAVLRTPLICLEPLERGQYFRKHVATAILKN